MHLAEDLGVRPQQQTLKVLTGVRIVGTPDVGRSSRRPPKSSSEHRVQLAGQESMEPISQYPFVGASLSGQENRPVLASTRKVSPASLAIFVWGAARD